MGSVNHERLQKTPSEGRSRASGRSSQGGPPATSSFEKTSLPSRRPITFSKQAPEKPIWLGYLFGLLGVSVLILFGGSHNSMALGLALMLPSMALIIQPPKAGLGRWADFAVCGFICCLMLAYIPHFYWPFPDWRIEAVRDFGIVLPSTVTIQPRITFEAICMAVAGFAWLYVASNWQINVNGRKHFFASLSVISGLFAAIIIWGNLYGARYPGAQDSSVFSFFSEPNQTAVVLVLSGIVGFAFAIEGLRGRKAIHLVGLFSTTLCLVALLVSASSSGLLFYGVGILLWFVARLRSKSVSGLFKVVFPLALIVFSLVVINKTESIEDVVQFFDKSVTWEGEHRALIYKDAITMFADTPLLGHGLGTFSAVFPQYREHSQHFQAVQHPQSDLLWVLSEVGIVGVAFLVALLVVYFKSCRGLSQGRSGFYRVIGLIALVVFLLYALVDVPAHRPGSVYFAIILMVFAIPRPATGRTFKPILWRVVGLFLGGVGVMWFVAGLTSAPFHSSAAIAYHDKKAASHIKAADYLSATASIEKTLHWKPLDWRAYFQRAQVKLAAKADRELVARDFRAARFVEPTLGEFSLEEGFIWLPFDLERTISAWRSAFSREIEFKDRAYESVLQAGRGDRELMNAVVELSKVDPRFRAMTFAYLRDSQFMTEIQVDLNIDAALSSFTRTQRTEIVKSWIRFGDLDSVQRFISDYSASLVDSWWLSSLLMKERVDFQEAVRYVREGLPIPVISGRLLEGAVLTRTLREFAVMPQDVAKGMVLLNTLIKQGSLERALEVTDAMLELDQPPASIYYWRGEILSQMDDVIESWYAFAEYVALVQ